MNYENRLRYRFLSNLGFIFSNLSYHFFHIVSLFTGAVAANEYVLMCITWPRLCFSVHLLWCISYAAIGTIQVIVGVFFFALNFLKLCSNLWIGVLNIIFGVGGAVYAMVGSWSLGKQRAFLYLAVSVLVVNVVNLVLLEVGEWHLLLPEPAKKLIEQGNVKMLSLYARTIGNLSTLVAAVIAFFDSQITFCSMLYHERRRKRTSDKQDVLSDTEYVLPRVKCDSDENVNEKKKKKEREKGSYFNRQCGQSWVYKTSTAESSTANSAPNRDSATSSDNLIDSKQTPGSASSAQVAAQFEEISGQTSKARTNAEQPLVVVEKTADYTDRQLHYMASFSRTPSPVPASSSSSADSSSQNSCSMIDGARLDHGREQKEQEPNAATEQPSPNHHTLRLDLAESSGTTGGKHRSLSPPSSVCSGEPLRHDSLTAADLHEETASQRSFKISADQIFIPLKDETVVRINDQVFITPNKPRRSSPQPTSSPSMGIAMSDGKAPQSFVNGSHTDQPSTGTGFSVTCGPIAKAGSLAVDKAKSALPEVVDVIRKELVGKKCHSKISPSSPQIQPELLPPQVTGKWATTAVKSAQLEAATTTLDSQQPALALANSLPSPSLSCEWSVTKKVAVEEEQECEKEDRVAMQSHSPPPSHLAAASTWSNNDKPQHSPSPTLERQPKVDGDEMVELPDNEPYMFCSSPLDRQDTVIAASQSAPHAFAYVSASTPTNERQTFIERQDAISMLSPREDKSYILPPSPPPPPQQLDDLSSPPPSPLFPSPIQMDHELRSSCSRNASVLNFEEADDHQLEGAVAAESDILQQRPCHQIGDFCDIREQRCTEAVEMAAECSLSTEIDNIFKIAEDSSRLDADANGDGAEDGYGNGNTSDDHPLDSNSSTQSEQQIPPPHFDATIFANIPPPEQTDDANGVNPEEWEESDDDSMNSSCVRRLPPPSTTSND